MKGLLIGGATLISIALGIWPRGATGSKPAWWRWLTISSMLALFVLALGIPTAGTFLSGAAVGQSRQDARFPVRGTVESVSSESLTLKDRSGRSETAMLLGM